MKSRYRIVINLGLLHLLFAILGNYQVTVFADEDAEDILTTYQLYSGAAQGYEFFAPEVSGASRVVFNLEYGDGSKATERFPPSDVNSEVRLRVGNVFNQFWDHKSRDNIIRSLTASWAGRYFNTHDSLKKVTVVIEEYQLPTMKLYVDGARSEWLETYSATYEKHTDPSS